MFAETPAVTAKDIQRLPSTMLKLRSKKFKDDGKKTLKTHQKYLSPLATKITIEIQFIHT